MRTSKWRIEPAPTSLNGSFSGYSQSLETTRAVYLTLTSTPFGEPLFACETLSPERGNARESAEARAK